jgi:hypothetical protein
MYRDCGGMMFDVWRWQGCDVRILAIAGVGLDHNVVAVCGGGRMLSPRGGRRILLVVEVVFESRGIVFVTGRSQFFIRFRMCRVPLLRREMTVSITSAFRSTMSDIIPIRCTGLSQVSSLFERHHFVDRSAPSHQQLHRHRDIMSAKQTSFFFFRKAR